MQNKNKKPIDDKTSIGFSGNGTSKIQEMPIKSTNESDEKTIWDKGTLRKTSKRRFF